MSFIYYDGNAFPRAQWNRAQAFWSRFHKAWGRHTENYNGTNIEVYDYKFIYYNNGFTTNKHKIRLMKELGIDWSEMLEEDLDDEIEELYLYLKGGWAYSGKRIGPNPDLIPSGKYEAPTRANVAHRLNKAFYDGRTINVTITYGGKTTRHIAEHELLYSIQNKLIVAGKLNTTKIRQVIEGQPWYYLAGSLHLDGYRPSVDAVVNSVKPINMALRALPVAQVTCKEDDLGILALLDVTNSVFKPVLDEDTTSDTYGMPKATSQRLRTESTGAVGAKSNEIIEYEYTLQFVYQGATTNKQLVKTIVDWYDHYEPEILVAPPTDLNDLPRRKITSTVNSDIKKLLVSLMVDPMTVPPETIYDPNVTYPTIKDGIYLKVPLVYDTTDTVSGVDDEGNQQDQSQTTTVVSYTDYLIVDAVRVMQKREFLRLVVKQLDSDYTVEDPEWWEPILFIVLVIVVVVVAFFTSGLSTAASPAIFAAFLGYAAIGFSIAGLVMSEVGGLSSQNYVRALGKFATITGYAATIVGLYAMISSMTQKLVEEAIKESLREAGKEMTQEAIAEGAKELIKELTATELASLMLEGAWSSISNMFVNAAMGSVGQLVNASMDVLKIAAMGMKFYNDQEIAKLKDMEIELEEAEAEYNDTILNKALMDSPMIYAVTFEKLSSPDLLQDMSEMKQRPFGQDKNFLAWYTDVNK